MGSTEAAVTELVPTTAALAPLHGGAIVTPAVSAALALEAQVAYHQLCEALLDQSDYQRIGSKDFRKKSGWRKLAVAFNVSVELVERIYERDEHNRIIRAEVVARATAPNGRVMDGLGACDLFEKCCAKARGKPCTIQAAKHHHCVEGCDGYAHFSNPSHDLPATAHTRATNRACADLFGMGEVSAEEVSADRGGYDQEPEVTYVGKAAKDALVARVKALEPDQIAELSQLREGAGISLKERTTTAQFETLEAWVANLEAGHPATGPEDEGGDAPEGQEPGQEAQGGAQDRPVRQTVPPGQHEPPAAHPVPQIPDDARVEDTGAEEAAQTTTIDLVKNMPAEEVDHELTRLKQHTEGKINIRRRRLVVALLREQMAQASAPSEQDPAPEA